MNDRPLFVIGCPRSGTTMLQLMLHSHPRIAVAPETRFLEPAYYKRRRFGDMRDPRNRESLAEWIADDKTTKFRELGLDRAEFVRQATQSPASLGSVIGTAFRMYADRFDKSRWGDKRPSYVRKTHILRRLFPDAQFIHLIRDGRDCVASLKEMPWYNLDTFHAVSAWAEAMDAGAELRRSLSADTYYELYYEHLTDDPATEMKKLCHFLGEDFDPASVSPEEAAKVAVPKHKVWHTNTHGEVTRSRVGTWTTRLQPWEISLCESALGDRLKDRGYELTGAPQAAAQHLAAFRATLRKRSKNRRSKLMNDRLNRLREPGPVPALLTDGQRAAAGLSPLRGKSAEVWVG
ncbi:sulfotransferase family protein [Nonomuraea sediminis]|uniref:sulfotransferase family protein n=1 Tax=Nonomuraea sediminis TaxID=2835864 RepID=UPI001BDBC217|nr:sulfotransferase [Nonomuraea sediminis]